MKKRQNIVTVTCLFTHLPTYSFFLDAIEEIYNKDASLFIHLIKRALLIKRFLCVVLINVLIKLIRKYIPSAHQLLVIGRFIIFRTLTRLNNLFRYARFKLDIRPKGAESLTHEVRSVPNCYSYNTLYLRAPPALSKVEGLK